MQSKGGFTSRFSIFSFRSSTPQNNGQAPLLKRISSEEPADIIEVNEVIIALLDKVALTSQEYRMRRILQSVRYKGRAIQFDGRNINDPKQYKDILHSICTLLQFDELNASQKGLLVCVWSFMRRKYKKKGSSSLLHLTALELLYTMILPASLDISKERNSYLWMVKSRHDEVIEAYAKMIEEMVDSLHNNDPEYIKDTFSHYVRSQIYQLHGWTLLHYVCATTELLNTEQLIAVLIECGIETNALDHTHRSALHVAAERFNLPAIKALVTYSSTSKILLDRDGRTPLEALLFAISISRWSTLLTAGKLVQAIELLLPFPGDWRILWTCQSSYGIGATALLISKDVELGNAVWPRLFENIPGDVSREIVARLLLTCLRRGRIEYVEQLTKVILKKLPSRNNAALESLELIIQDYSKLFDLLVTASVHYLDDPMTIKVLNVLTAMPIPAYGKATTLGLFWQMIVAAKHQTLQVCTNSLSDEQFQRFFLVQITPEAINKETDWMRPYILGVGIELVVAMSVFELCCALKRNDCLAVLLKRLQKLKRNTSIKVNWSLLYTQLVQQCLLAKNWYGFDCIQLVFKDPWNAADTSYWQELCNLSGSRMLHLIQLSCDDRNLLQYSEDDVKIDSKINSIFWRHNANTPATDHIGKDEVTSAETMQRLLQQIEQQMSTELSGNRLVAMRDQPPKSWQIIRKESVVTVDFENHLSLLFDRAMRLRRYILDDEFRMGIRRLARNFPTDVRWTKLSFHLQQYFDLLDSSFDKSKYTMASSVHWEGLEKRLSSAARSRVGMRKFIDSVLLCCDFSSSARYWEMDTRNLEAFANIFSDPSLKVERSAAERKTIKSPWKDMSFQEYHEMRKNDPAVTYVHKVLEEALLLFIQIIQVITNVSMMERNDFRGSLSKVSRRSYVKLYFLGKEHQLVQSKLAVASSQKNSVGSLFLRNVLCADSNNLWQAQSAVQSQLLSSVQKAEFYYSFPHHAAKKKVKIATDCRARFEDTLIALMKSPQPPQEEEFEEGNCLSLHDICALVFLGFYRAATTQLQLIKKFTAEQAKALNLIVDSEDGSYQDCIKKVRAHYSAGSSRAHLISMTSKAEHIRVITPLHCALLDGQVDFAVHLLEVVQVWSIDVYDIIRFVQETKIFRTFGFFVARSLHLQNPLISGFNSLSNDRMAISLWSSKSHYSSSIEHGKEIFDVVIQFLQEKFADDSIQTWQANQASSQLDFLSRIVSTDNNSEVKFVQLMDSSWLPLETLEQYEINLLRAQPIPEKAYSSASFGHDLLLFISRLFHHQRVGEEEQGNETVLQDLCHSGHGWNAAMHMPNTTGIQALFYLIFAGKYDACLTSFQQKMVEDMLFNREVASPVSNNEGSLQQHLDQMILTSMTQRCQTLEKRAFITASPSGLPTFGSLLKGSKPPQTVEALCSASLEYVQQVWKVLTKTSYSTRFVQLCTIEKIGKLDCMLRARQILSVLQLPLSAIATSNGSFGPSLDRNLNFTNMDPSFLMRRVTSGMYTQLKLIVSGWLRFKLTGNMSTLGTHTAMTMFHSPWFHSLQYLSKDVSTYQSAALINTQNKEELIRTLMRNLVNELSSVNDEQRSPSGRQITAASMMFQKQEVDISSVLEAVGYAELIIEMARALCMARVLCVVSYSCNDSSVQDSIVVKYSDHPVCILRDELRQAHESLARVQIMCSGERLSGLSARIRLCDFITSDDFLRMTAVNNSYSSRLKKLREIVLRCLCAICADINRNNWGKMITRLGNIKDLASGNSPTRYGSGRSLFPLVIDDDLSTLTGPANVGNNLANTHAPQESDNKVLAEEILPRLQSFKIGDFWKTGRFPIFRQQFESITIDNDEALIGAIEGLKVGKPITVTKEEERHIVEVFHTFASPSNVNRATQTAEQIAEESVKRLKYEKSSLEMLENLKVALRVVSELYWFTSTCYGLIKQSQTSSLYDYDKMILQEKSKKFSPFIGLIFSGLKKTRQDFIKAKDWQRFLKQRVKCCQELIVTHRQDCCVVDEFNQSPFDVAVLYGDADILEVFLQYAPIDCIKALPGYDHLLWRALMLCPYSDDTAVGNDATFGMSQYQRVVKLLVQFQFPITAPHEECISCIELAAIKGMPQFATILYRRVSDTATTTSSTTTAAAITNTNLMSPSRAGIYEKKIAKFGITITAVVALALQYDVHDQDVSSDFIDFLSKLYTADGMKEFNLTQSLFNTPYRVQEPILKLADSLTRSLYYLYDPSLKLGLASVDWKNLLTERFCGAWKKLVQAFDRRFSSMTIENSFSNCSPIVRDVAELTRCLQGSAALAPAPAAISWMMMDLIILSQQPQLIAEQFHKHYPPHVILPLETLAKDPNNAVELEQEPRYQALIGGIFTLCSLGQTMALKQFLELIIEQLNANHSPTFHLMSSLLGYPNPHRGNKTIWQVVITSQGREEMVKDILHLGMRLDLGGLLYQVRKGRISDSYASLAFEYLLEHTDNDLIDEELATYRQDYDESALHLLSCRGYARCVSVWLKLVTQDVLESDDAGYSPLQCSIAHGHAEVTRLFRSHCPPYLLKAVQDIVFAMKMNRLRSVIARSASKEEIKEYN